jgi:hypothetical protein
VACLKYGTPVALTLKPYLQFFWALILDIGRHGIDKHDNILTSSTTTIGWRLGMLCKVALLSATLERRFFMVQVVSIQQSRSREDAGFPVR